MFKTILTIFTVVSTATVSLGETVPFKQFSFPRGWKAEKGAVKGSSAGDKPVHLKDKRYSDKLSVSLYVTPQKVRGSSWKVASIQFKDKAGNYWQLALIEYPDKMLKKHIFNLKKNGKKLKRKPKVISDYNRGGWEYGKTYKLSLNLSKDRIDGIVRDEQGIVLKQVSCELTSLGTKYTPVIRLRQMSADFSG